MEQILCECGYATFSGWICADKNYDWFVFYHMRGECAVGRIRTILLKYYFCGAELF